MKDMGKMKLKLVDKLLDYYDNTHQLLDQFNSISEYFLGDNQNHDAFFKASTKQRPLNTLDLLIWTMASEKGYYLNSYCRQFSMLDQQIKQIKNINAVYGAFPSIDYYLAILALMMGLDVDHLPSVNDGIKVALYDLNEQKDYRHNVLVVTSPLQKTSLSASRELLMPEAASMRRFFIPELTILFWTWIRQMPHQCHFLKIILRTVFFPMKKDGLVLMFGDHSHPNIDHVISHCYTSFSIGELSPAQRLAVSKLTNINQDTVDSFGLTESANYLGDFPYNNEFVKSLLKGSNNETYCEWSIDKNYNNDIEVFYITLTDIEFLSDRDANLIDKLVDQIESIMINAGYYVNDITPIVTMLIARAIRWGRLKQINHLKTYVQNLEEGFRFSIWDWDQMFGQDEFLISHHQSVIQLQELIFDRLQVDLNQPSHEGNTQEVIGGLSITDSAKQSLLIMSYAKQPDNLPIESIHGDINILIPLISIKLKLGKSLDILDNLLPDQLINTYRSLRICLNHLDQDALIKLVTSKKINVAELPPLKTNDEVETLLQFVEAIPQDKRQEFSINHWLKFAEIILHCTKEQWNRLLMLGIIKIDHLVQDIINSTEPEEDPVEKLKAYAQLFDVIDDLTQDEKLLVSLNKGVEQFRDMGCAAYELVYDSYRMISLLLKKDMIKADDFEAYLMSQNETTDIRQSKEKLAYEYLNEFYVDSDPLSFFNQYDELSPIDKLKLIELLKAKDFESNFAVLLTKGLNDEQLYCLILWLFKQDADKVLVDLCQKNSVLVLGINLRIRLLSKFPDKADIILYNEKINTIDEKTFESIAGYLNNAKDDGMRAVLLERIEPENLYCDINGFNKTKTLVQLITLLRPSEKERFLINHWQTFRFVQMYSLDNDWATLLDLEMIEITTLVNSFISDDCQDAKLLAYQQLLDVIDDLTEDEQLLKDFKESVKQFKSLYSVETYKSVFDSSKMVSHLIASGVIELSLYADWLQDISTKNNREVTANQKALDLLNNEYNEMKRSFYADQACLKPIYGDMSSLDQLVVIGVYDQVRWKHKGRNVNQFNHSSVQQVLKLNVYQLYWLLNQVAEKKNSDEELYKIFMIKFLGLNKLPDEIRHILISRAPNIFIEYCACVDKKLIDIFKRGYLNIEEFLESYAFRESPLISSKAFNYILSNNLFIEKRDDRASVCLLNLAIKHRVKYEDCVAKMDNHPFELTLGSCLNSISKTLFKNSQINADEFAAYVVQCYPNLFDADLKKALEFLDKKSVIRLLKGKCSGVLSSSIRDRTLIDMYTKDNIADVSSYQDKYFKVQMNAVALLVFVIVAILLKVLPLVPLTSTLGITLALLTVIGLMVVGKNASNAYRDLGKIHEVYTKVTSKSIATNSDLSVINDLPSQKGSGVDETNSYRK
ncbi:MAG: hypothetical protein ACON5A_02665 [Candidatus Comchoanobacterales bacterium]